jgi:hypothetical protein
MPLLICFLVFFKLTTILVTPIFYDEAIYLLQAQEVLKGNLFAAFSGVQFPILTWVLAVVKIISGWAVSPLISGRFTSASFDVFSAYLIYLIGKKLVNTRLGLASSIIYISLPLTFLHGKFVMSEPLTNMFCLIVVLAILSGKKWEVAIFSLLAFFTKPIAVVTLIPAYLLDLKKNLKAVLLTGFITTGVFLPLATSFFGVHLNNAALGYSSWIALFKLNIFKTWLWMQGYLTWPVIVTCFGSIFLALKTRNLKILWLGLWLITVVAVNSIFGKHYYPRHIYFLAPPVALLSAYLIYKLPTVLPVMVLLIFAWRIDYQLFTNPSKAMIGEDRQQFYEDWSSGVGFLSLEKWVQSHPGQYFIEDDPLLRFTLPTANIYEKDIIKSGDFLVANQQDDVKVGVEVVTKFFRNSGRAIIIYRVL